MQPIHTKIKGEKNNNIDIHQYTNIDVNIITKLMFKKKID